MSLHRIPISPLSRPPRSPPAAAPPAAGNPAEDLKAVYYPHPIKNNAGVFDEMQMIFAPLMGEGPTVFGQPYIPHVDVELYIRHVGFDMLGYYDAVADFMFLGVAILQDSMMANTRMLYWGVCHMLYHLDFVLRFHGCEDDNREHLISTYMKKYKTALRAFMKHRWGVGHRHLVNMLFNNESSIDALFFLKPHSHRIKAATILDFNRGVAAWANTEFPVIYRFDEYPVVLLSYPGDTKCNPVDIAVIDTLVAEEELSDIPLHGEAIEF